MVSTINACLWNSRITIDFIGAVAGQGYYTESIWPFHFVDVNCSGNEMTLFECPHNNLTGTHNCIYNHDASVRCQGISSLDCSCSSCSKYTHLSLYFICCINMFIPQIEGLMFLITVLMVM